MKCTLCFPHTAVNIRIRVLNPAAMLYMYNMCAALALFCTISPSIKKKQKASYPDDPVDVMLVCPCHVHGHIPPTSISTCSWGTKLALVSLAGPVLGHLPKLTLRVMAAIGRVPCLS